MSSHLSFRQLVVVDLATFNWQTSVNCWSKFKFSWIILVCWCYLANWTSDKKFDCNILTLGLKATWQVSRLAWLCLIWRHDGKCANCQQQVNTSYQATHHLPWHISAPSSPPHYYCANLTTVTIKIDSKHHEKKKLEMLENVSNYWP